MRQARPHSDDGDRVIDNLLHPRKLAVHQCSETSEHYTPSNIVTAVLPAQSSPLGETLARYNDFFALFENFSGYVDFLLLQDLVTDDRAAVTFFMPFDDFKTPSVPEDDADVQGIPTSKRRVHRGSKPSDRPTRGRSLTQASRLQATRLSPVRAVQMSARLLMPSHRDGVYFPRFFRADIPMNRVRSAAA